MIWDFLLNNIGEITGFLLGIGVVIPFYARAKNIIVKLGKALEDDKITKEEALEIWNAIKGK